MDEPIQTPLSGPPPIGEVPLSPVEPSSPVKPESAPPPLQPVIPSTSDMPAPVHGQSSKSKTVKQVLISLLLLLITGASIWGVLKNIEKRQNTESQASGSDVRLSLVASPQSVSVGETFTVVLYIDPSISNYHISAVDVPLTYPSSIVTLQGIEVGNFFGQYHTVGSTEMLNKNDMTVPGIAKIILGSPCTVAAPWICYPQMTQTMTVGELARLTFHANAAGSVDIGFVAANVKIAAREYADPANSVNVVDPNFLASTTVTATDDSITPSVTPPGTPMPSETPIPSQTPTATPSPTPACVQKTFVSGSASPATLTPGGTATVVCDYGYIDGPCVGVNTQNNDTTSPWSGCSYTGASGTATNWQCTARSTTGTFTNTCVTVPVNPINCCEQQNQTGSITIAGPTITPTPSTVPTPTEDPDEDHSNVTIRMKFYGIASLKPPQTVKVTFIQGTSIEYQNAALPIQSDENGVFSGIVPNIPEGTYDVYIKGWAHLQKKFTAQLIDREAITLDLTSFLLIAGDIAGGVTGDNRLNIVDIGRITEHYAPLYEMLSDLNLDGNVNILDIGILTDHYFEEGDSF